MYDFRRKNLLHGLCYIAIIFVLYIVSYTDIVSLKIGNASPMPLIAPIIAAGIFYGEWIGFAAGLITGIFVDAVSSQSDCFNTLILLFIGCAAGILIKYYLNNNILSACCLSVGACALYFILYFIISNFTESRQGFQYLLFYALPSAVYSAVFIIPCYYLGKLIKKI